ncbi:MAG TPA: phage tail length tape measure family protein [Microvirga sp.]|jgi:hypothetical protein|nr:phage tail length tape measure family protein [Microvirga sp.]
MTESSLSIKIDPAPAVAGGAEAKRALEGVKAAAVATEQSVEKLDRATGSFGATAERSSRRTTTLAEAAEQLRRQTEQATRMNGGLQQAVDALNRSLQAEALALGSVESATGRLRDAQGRFVKMTDDAARAALGAGGANDNLAGSLDHLKAKYVPLFAAQESYKSQLAEIAQLSRAGALTTVQWAEALDRARAGYAAQVAGLNGVAQASQRVWTNTGNITAQFQDVAVMLASGQSPFITAMQQGTQLALALDGENKGVKGALKSVGAGFLGLLSPMTLVSIGAIALGGTAVQALMSIGGEVETLDNRIKRHADLVKSLRDAYGLAKEGAEEYARDSAAVIESQLRGTTRRLAAELKDLTKEFLDRSTAGPTRISPVPGIDLEFADGVGAATVKYRAFEEAIARLQSSLDAGSPKIREFREEISQIERTTTDQTVKKLANEILETTKRAAYLEARLFGAANGIQALDAKARASLANMESFRRALSDISSVEPVHLSKWDEALQAHATAIEKARGNTRLMEEADQRLLDVQGRIISEEQRENEITRKQIELSNARTAADRARLSGELELLQSSREMSSADAAVERAALRRLEVTEAARRQMADMLTVQGQEIELLAIERANVGKSADEVERLLAAKRAEHDLINAGLPLRSREGQLYVDNAQKIAANRAELDRFKQQVESVASVLTNALQDAFTTAGASLGTFLTSLGKGFSGVGFQGLQTNLISPLLSGNNTATLTALTDAIKTGSTQGVTAGWDKLASSVKGNGPVFGASYGQAGMTGLVAGLGGYSTGYQSQSPLMGALGGAMGGLGAGLATGNPIMAAAGAVIGGIAGLIGGITGAADAAAEKLRQATKAWNQQKDAIEAWKAEMTDGGMGSLAAWRAENKATAVKAMQLAREADMPREAREIQKAFREGWKDTVQDFKATIDGLIASLESGAGPSGPFMAAAAAIDELGKTLAGLVSDAETANESVRDVRKAGAAYALGLLNPQDQSEFASRLAEVQGAAAGLKDVLIDLGMSAEDAGKAVRGELNEALRTLRGDFKASLTARINDAQGNGYLNDLADAERQRGLDLKDAKAVGIDKSLVQNAYEATVRDIIEGADLTSEALADLQRQFPDLASVIADLGSTVSDELDNLKQSIADFVLDLKLGPQSALSPGDQFAAAQKAYGDTLAKAQGGDTAALGNLQGVAQAYLSASQGMFASGPQYAAIFNDVLAQLGKIGAVPGFARGGRVRGRGGPQDDAIPALLSDGEFVVNAQAAARHEATLVAMNTGVADPVGRLRRSAGIGRRNRFLPTLWGSLGEYWLPGDGAGSGGSIGGAIGGGSPPGTGGLAPGVGSGGGGYMPGPGSAPTPGSGGGGFVGPIDHGLDRDVPGTPPGPNPDAQPVNPGPIVGDYTTGGTFGGGPFTTGGGFGGVYGTGTGTFGPPGLGTPNQPTSGAPHSIPGMPHGIADGGFPLGGYPGFGQTGTMTPQEIADQIDDNGYFGRNGRGVPFHPGQLTPAMPTSVNPILDQIRQDLKKGTLKASFMSLASIGAMVQDIVGLTAYAGLTPAQIGAGSLFGITDPAVIGASFNADGTANYSNRDSYNYTPHNLGDVPYNSGGFDGSPGSASTPGANNDGPGALGGVNDGSQPYALGGWVRGPGSSTSDSIAARLSAGEFVVRASQAEQWAPVLEAINSGHWPGSAGAGNDNHDDWGPVVDELRLLRAEQAQSREEIRRLNEVIETLAKAGVRSAVAAETLAGDREPAGQQRAQGGRR